MTDSPGNVTPVAYSHALMTGEGHDLRRTKLVELNLETSKSRTCAWPHCTASLSYNRVGILCREHGEAVADAVLEDRVVNRYFEVHGQAVVADMTKRANSARMAEEERRARQRSEDAKSKRGEPGHVYYLAVGERVKIGFSTDVRRRLRTYPPGSKLLAMEPGTLHLESLRHGQFRQFLAADREWFTPNAELSAHVNELNNKHGYPIRFTS